MMKVELERLQVRPVVVPMCDFSIGNKKVAEIILVLARQDLYPALRTFYAFSSLGENYTLPAATLETIGIQIGRRKASMETESEFVLVFYGRECEFHPPAYLEGIEFEHLTPSQSKVVDAAIKQGYALVLNATMPPKVA